MGSSCGTKEEPIPRTVQRLRDNGYCHAYYINTDPWELVKAGAIWVDGKSYGPEYPNPESVKSLLKREHYIYQVLGEHRHITKCHGLEVDEKGEARALRLELSDRCDLRLFIINNRKPPALRHRLWVAHMFADGVRYIHSRRVLWCNLSTQNAFLFNDTELKLCEFFIATHGNAYCEPSGYSCELRYYPALPSGECPAYGTLAFELSALGTAIYEITEWTVPYGAGASLADIERKLDTRERPRISEQNPCRGLIERCWDFKVKSAAEVEDALRQMYGKVMAAHRESMAAKAPKAAEASEATGAAKASASTE